MTDEPKGVTPEPKQDPAPVIEAPNAEPKKAVTVDDLQATIEELQRQIKNKSEENDRLFKKAKKFEDEAESKRQAELSEAEKLKEALEKANGELRSFKTNELKRQAAGKFQLPDELASRLTGNTLEELEADAEKLAGILPKAEPKPKISTTNPGAVPTKSKDDELRETLFKRGAPIFDRAWAEQHGGGVIEINKED